MLWLIYLCICNPPASMYSESRGEARDFARVRNACFEQVNTIAYGYWSLHLQFLLLVLVRFIFSWIEFTICNILFLSLVSYELLRYSHKDTPDRLDRLTWLATRLLRRNSAWRGRHTMCKWKQLMRKLEKLFTDKGLIAVLHVDLWLFQLM